MVGFVLAILLTLKEIPRITKNIRFNYLYSWSVRKSQPYYLLIATYLYFKVKIILRNYFLTTERRIFDKKKLSNQ